MISKKVFCETVNEMKRLNEAEMAISDVFTSNGLDFNSFSFAPYVEITYKLLSAAISEGNEMIDDEISYWIFDLDFGKSYNEDWAIVKFDENEYKIDLTSAEKFYDYLIKYIIPSKEIFKNPLKPIDISEIMC